MIQSVFDNMVFVALVEDNATMSSIPGILKIMYRILCKTNEVDPIKLISLRHISVSITLKYMINNSILK